MGLSDALRSGFYGQGENGAVECEADARFYGAAGFPKKGPVCFSLTEVDNISWRAQAGDPKPILVMRNYDPAMVPYLAEGKIGGLVVATSYMASHLKMLCETHMVSGLFGVMPKGTQSMRGEFNEESAPDGPAYFTGDTATINGKEVRKGQSILISYGGNGFVSNPPEQLQTPSLDADSINNDMRLKSDVSNLRQMKECFQAFFKGRGQRVLGVKANVNSSKDLGIAVTDDIGLMRTEQMVAVNGYLREHLKHIILEDDMRSYSALASESQRHYSEVMQRLADGKAVKIRLYDFVFSELLDKQEQKKFLELYPRLDMHGAEALETFSTLYREQIKSIFRALQNTRAKDKPMQPLEIMMPAVRTEQDVLAIKGIIDAEARKFGIDQKRYSFGVMIETLEACANISAIAPHCDFISFGTNDLTQQYTGISRADFKAHLRYAKQHGYDPFKTMAPEVLDIVGDVTAHARLANPNIRVDVCGGQAAEPATAEALSGAGVDNISVAPNVNNLYVMPMALYYKAYDAMQNPQLNVSAQAAAQLTAVWR